MGLTEKQKEANDRHKRTKKGVTARIYSNQRKSSKRRGHPMPTYTGPELRDWLFGQELFHKLYDGWVESGYVKEEKPSVDRISNKLPYTMRNIRLMTWGENSKRAYKDRYDNIDKRDAAAVIQMDMDGNFIRKHHSITYAARSVDGSRGSIWLACKGKYSQSYGFKWRLASA